MRILLIEDESEFAKPIVRALTMAGYIVDLAENKMFAKSASKENKYDFILLDRTLPDGDGLSLVSTFRSDHENVPIIILSARGETDDRVIALDSGVDDYLPKPFSLSEMLARIRAVSRRPNKLAASKITLGNTIYFPENNEVFVNNIRLILTRRELNVLSTLIYRHECTVLRTTLENAVFGYDDDIQSNTLDSHISRLRRKMYDAKSDVGIRTIRGVGYIMRLEK